MYQYFCGLYPNSFLQHVGQDAHQPVSQSFSGDNESASPVGSARVPPMVAPRRAPKPRKVWKVLMFCKSKRIQAQNVPLYHFSL